MSIFDFLKRKKSVEKAKEKKPEKKTDKVLTAKETPVLVPPWRDTTGQAKKGKKIANFSYDIVKEPHISEKATNLAEKNKYIFRIYSGSNKPEIKKSIEGIYGVDVLLVNVIKIPRKKRRLGRSEGFKKGYIKAIVTIKEGQKIEII